MKKKILLSSIIASMLLCSCSTYGKYETNSQDVNVYLLEKAIKGESFESTKMATVSPLFIKNEKYVPYFTLEDYASMIEPFLEEGSKSEVTYVGNSATWKITVNGQLYFTSTISSDAKNVSKLGDINYATSNALFERDTEALSYRTHYDSQALSFGGAGATSYSFSNVTFKRFIQDDKVYYPLGFYDMTYSASAGIYVYYNYKNIYITQDADNFAEEFVDADGNTTTVEREMEAITAGEKIPQYLIDYNANAFVYMMENFYGMKHNYQLSSIKSFYQSSGLYAPLFSGDDVKRGNAFSEALGVFDDNHTVFVSASDAWGEKGTKRIGGSRMYKRQALKNKLLSAKKKYLSEYFNNDNYDYDRGQWADTVTSESGKTAMFYFDSFVFGTKDEVFKEDGSIKATAKEHDTYFNFLNRLRQYSNSMGIENVIIDVSTNGGGVVGVMARLLALMSKNNSAPLAMLDESTSIGTYSKVSVDVNEDDQYTEDETFGNLNYYILTSDCSYSCGNAFPCIAKQMGIKIIGEKSGGGECAVGIHYLPNSEYIYHSSRLHLGYYSEATGIFNGFEPGAAPDYSLVPEGKPSLLQDDGRGGYLDNIPSNFYDVDYLESLITAE